MVTLSPSSFCNCTSDGISSTQGGHHVAQKFSTTGLPRSCSSETVCCESVMVKSGAALPMRGGCDPVLQASEKQEAQQSIATEAKRFTLL